MAVSMDQQPGFKHFCRICKKGFGCGRALGGHMRAHGIGDEAGHADDEDPASDWEEKLGGCSPPPATHKRMYALRTNPNRLRSCRVCENCGKEFSSWKSFLEHGKCGYEDAESLVSSPRSEEDGGEANDEDGCHGQSDCGGGWSKGKRSRRFLRMGSSSNCPSSEEEDLANWLVMLSSARVDPLVAETEESCASASKDEDRQRCGGGGGSYSGAAMAGEIKAPVPFKGVPRGLFECKACKKVFTSHQALGGHRASHKKVKGCFAARQDEHHPDESQTEEEVITHDEFLAASKVASMGVQFEHQHPAFVPTKRKSKVHECSICHRVFASGQALGGHKRCHWVTSNTPEPSIARLHHLQEQSHQLHPVPKFSKSELLDLNLPAPVDDLPVVRQDNEAPLRLDVSASLYLQPWMGTHPSSNINNCNNMINMSSPLAHLDSEADSKVKLAKLSDLKDMNTGGSSPWLQVGIGTSTANEGRVP